MSRYPLVIAIVVVSALPLRVSAADKECTQLEAYAAEVVTDYLNSWENVYAFFKQFPHCYDGAIAEGAEDRIQLLWANQWNRLPKMVALSQNNPEFKAFLLRLLESEAFPQDVFSIVVQNARKRCPSTAREFCLAVLKKAKRQ